MKNNYNVNSEEKSELCLKLYKIDQIFKMGSSITMDALAMIHAVFFISIIYKQHFFQLVKFPKKISNKLVFWPEKKQHL